MSTEHVGGNGSAIDSEIEQLALLRDRLTDAADRLRRLRITGWTGAAADAFDKAAAGMCLGLYRAADLHDDAATELAVYRAVHRRVGALVANTLAGWPSGAVPAEVAEQVAGLHTQLDDAGRRAAAGVRTAAAGLHEIQRRLRELSPDERQPVPMAVPIVPFVPPGPTGPTGHGDEPKRTETSHQAPPAPLVAPAVDLDPATKYALVAELRGATYFFVEDS